MSYIHKEKVVFYLKKWSFCLEIMLQCYRVLRIFSAYMLSRFSCVWLCDPMDGSPLGSSVQGILQARMLEWIAMPSSSISFGKFQFRRDRFILHSRCILFTCRKSLLNKLQPRSIYGWNSWEKILIFFYPGRLFHRCLSSNERLLFVRSYSFLQSYIMYM